ncbi:hypothetical protein [Woodsholea maritima]|uniref:hypothetical protein n=1 Tax=Woodsholea maritima TaxID=240237 RepID=UPI0003672F00|nr:hypothetical protein [Woodsholea maritima]
MFPEYFKGIPSEASADYRELVAFCNAHHTTVLAALPWIAAEIAGREGFDTLFRMQRRTGGRRLYVPQNKDKLQTRLGVDLAHSTLEALLKGSAPTYVVDLPSSWGIFTAIRRAAIQIAIKHHIDKDDILKDFGITQKALRAFQQKS